MKKRHVRPFCRSCGADLAHPTTGCEDPKGCGKVTDPEGGPPFHVESLPERVSDSPAADFERKHAWSLRDRVFDAWIAAQERADEDSKHGVWAANNAPEFDDHSRIVAWALKPDRSDPYVLLHYAHDGSFKKRGEPVSQRDVLEASECIAVNNTEQARAIVKSLVFAFGKEVLKK